MVRRLASTSFAQRAAQLFGAGWLDKYFEQKYLEFRTAGSRHIYLKYKTGRVEYNEKPQNILKTYNDGSTLPSGDTIDRARRHFLGLVKNIPNDLEHEHLRVKKIAAWINDHAVYKTDSTRWGKIEYWSSPYDLWAQYEEQGTFEDDCDGWAALMWWALILIGIPEDRVFIWAGDVKKIRGSETFGHANILYDNPFYGPVHIEGSFYPEQNQNNWMEYEWEYSDRYVKTWFFFNSKDLRVA